MIPWRDRVVMISGASRGIGLAIARRLAHDGATLSLGGRNLGSLTRGTSDLAEERTTRWFYDALEPATAGAWVDSTVTRFGRVDGLVNCAGILEKFTLEEGDTATLDRLFAVNVKGPLELTRRTLPHLRASGCGRIVNVSSLSGVRVASDQVGYAISKFGLTALSHATRRAAWDDGVRVTNLSPGFVDTDMPRDIHADVDWSTATQPADLAAIVSMVMSLPNSASVSQLNVACRYDPGT